MFVYVCIYVYIFICVYVCIYMCVCVCVCVCMCSFHGIWALSEILFFGLHLPLQVCIWIRRWVAEDRTWLVQSERLSKRCLYSLKGIWYKIISHLSVSYLYIDSSTWSTVTCNGSTCFVPISGSNRSFWKKKYMNTWYFRTITFVLRIVT